MSNRGSSWSVTWYWNGRWIKMACTSFHHHGRDHLRSQKLHGLLPTGWLISMALSCPTPGILISSGVFTLEELKKKDMYPSCTLIISIKHLCFTQLVCLETTFYQYFITDQLTDHHSFLSSWSQSCLRLLPTDARDPLSTLWVVGGRSLVWPVCSYVWTGSVPRSWTTDPARAVRIQQDDVSPNCYN
jgi:hypothetical protein